MKHCQTSNFLTLMCRYCNFRIFAGMLYKLDESVGKVVSALKQNGN